MAKRKPSSKKRPKAYGILPMRVDLFKLSYAHACYMRVCLGLRLYHPEPGFDARTILMHSLSLN